MQAIPLFPHRSVATGGSLVGLVRGVVRGLVVAGGVEGIGWAPKVVHVDAMSDSRQ